MRTWWPPQSRFHWRSIIHTAPTPYRFASNMTRWQTECNSSKCTCYLFVCRYYFLLLHKQRFSHSTMSFQPVFQSTSNKATHFQELTKLLPSPSRSKSQSGMDTVSQRAVARKPGASLSYLSWGNTSPRWSDLTIGSAKREGLLNSLVAAALSDSCHQWGLSHHKAGPRSTDQKPPGIPQGFWPQQNQERKTASFPIPILHFESMCSLEETHSKQ